MKTAPFPPAFLSVLAVLLLVGPAFAQTTGTIEGVIKDPSGAVVPGVKVTLTNEETGQQREATSDESGYFRILQVPVGRYSLVLESKGFKKYVRKGIILELNQTAHVDIELQVGDLAESVTVEANASQVETTSTQLGAVVGERAVVQLPLATRDTYQLLQLQPGVQSQVGSDLFFGSERAGVVSVNGGRGRANNYMVNGGDGNDLFANLPAIEPSPDSIQEFRVITNNFDAEYGRNSGAIVNVVTKSGTNDFHGSLYEFFRNKVLNARAFFNPGPPPGTPPERLSAFEKADFKQNQFGGTFGGPVKSNQTFFFVSYEGRRVRRGILSDTVTVPTLAERGGDFSGSDLFTGAVGTPLVADILTARLGRGANPVEVGDLYNCASDPAACAASGRPSVFPGNIVPLAAFDPVALDLFRQFVPQGNLADDLFQSVPLSRETVDKLEVKMDHKLTTNQNLTGYFYFNQRDFLQPFSRFQAGGAALPGFGATTDERIQQWNISHTWTINASTVNEFRFAYFREAQGKFLHPERTHLLTDSCSTPAARPFCFTGVSDVGAFPSDPKLGITPGLGANREGVPFVDVSGSFSIGNNLEGELPQTGNSFQWVDNFSKIVGNHTLKFGADIRRQRFDQFLYFDVNGSYFYFGGGPNDTGNLVANYFLGLPDQLLQGAAQLEAIRTSSFYLYGQDSWKIRPSLTLNYGLRWELNTPLHDRFDRVQTFRPGQPTSIYPCQLDPAFSQSLIDTFGTRDCNPGSAGGSVFPLGLVVPGDTGIAKGLTQTYFKSFAPRIGLAWSPGWKNGWLRKLTGGPDKTSIRMGWGMFYNPIEQLVIEQFSAEPPFGGSSSIFNPLFATPFVVQDGTVAPNPFGGILNPQPGQAVDWARFRPIVLFGQFQPNMRSQYSVQYNLTIQREITPNLVFQIGYVGSQGHRLLATHDLNYGIAETCLDLQNISDLTGNADLACGPFFADSAFFIPADTIPTGVTLRLPYGSVPSVTGPNATDITLVGLRPFSSPLCQPTTGAGCPPDGVPIFSSVFAQDTIANSSYNSFQASVNKRFSKGVQLLAAYTWSKSMDQASSFENLINPFNPSLSRSLSQFDARHRFVLSYLWELPLPKYDGAAGKFLNGWAISGITAFQSGFPIRITSSDDFELQSSFDFELPGQPDIVAPFRKLDPRGPGNLGFDPNSFAPQALGTTGNAPRTICCGPGLNNFDIAVLKETKLSERVGLQFRAEFFNVVNHAQFANPDGDISDGPDFGRVKRVRDPRLIQFALKLFF